MEQKIDSIKVICRFRPLADCQEKSSSIQILPNNNVMANGQIYGFDRVFNQETRQETVFNQTAKEIVNDVLNGYNGTILAYGQTNSGKTHTMMGDLSIEHEKGLIPRLTESLFYNILHAPRNLEFTVKISFMEIYMEKIRDLLNPMNDNLVIHENKDRGIYVKDLMQVFVGSVHEVMELLLKGNISRVVSSTNMNDSSSRSHALFLLTISQKNLDTGIIKTGKLSLVDLAGSEKVAKTGASGQTLEEAKKINRSLSALGNVINALTDGKSHHVPYRDSKLTRILQESIGGNSKTTLIITCSPSLFNSSETISTLRFGVRAKTIKNSIHMNAELSPCQLKQMLKNTKSQLLSTQLYVQKLESELRTWRSEGFVKETEWIPLDSILSIKSGTSAIDESILSEDDLQDDMQDESIILQDEQENELEKESILQELELELQESIESIHLKDDSKDQLDKFILEKQVTQTRDAFTETEKEEILKSLSNSSSKDELKTIYESDSAHSRSVSNKGLEEEEKLAILETSLESLEKVQKQLVDQNKLLKTQVSQTQDKLFARSNRIKELEAQLTETSMKLESQRQQNFGIQMIEAKERLENPTSQLEDWIYSSRIAKPLRGTATPTSTPEKSKKSKSAWYVSLIQTPK